MTIDTSLEAAKNLLVCLSNAMMDRNPEIKSPIFNIEDAVTIQEWLVAKGFAQEYKCQLCKDKFYY